MGWVVLGRVAGRAVGGRGGGNGGVRVAIFGASRLRGGLVTNWGDVMSRWAWGLVLGVVLVAVFASGCVAKVAGVPVGSASSGRAVGDPERIHADDALGDLSAWNPCSVVDPDALPAAWTADVDVPVGFEYCLLTVATEDGTEADVEVGPLYRATHDLEEHRSGERDGGLTVVPYDSGDDSCVRDIVFADGIALVVRSWPYDAGDASKMCGIGDVVVEQVVDSVVGGRAASLRFSGDSLGDVDPCELVTGEMAALVPGVTADVEAERQVARHSCWWDAADGNSLSVQFQVGDLPDGEVEEERQGRFTSVVEYDDDETSSLCAVNGEHVPFKHESRTFTEYVAVYVYLKPGQVEQACAAASAVADALWPKLPPL